MIAYLYLQWLIWRIGVGHYLLTVASCHPVANWLVDE